MDRVFMDELWLIQLNMWNRPQGLWYLQFEYAWTSVCKLLNSWKISLEINSIWMKYVYAWVEIAYRFLIIDRFLKLSISLSLFSICVLVRYFTIGYSTPMGRRVPPHSAGSPGIRYFTTCIFGSRRQHCSSCQFNLANNYPRKKVQLTMNLN